VSLEMSKGRGGAARSGGLKPVLHKVITFTNKWISLDFSLLLVLVISSIIRTLRSIKNVSFKELLALSAFLFLGVLSICRQCVVIFWMKGGDSKK
jgi:hypothetical protein